MHHDRGLSYKFTSIIRLNRLQILLNFKRNFTIVCYGHLHNKNDKGIRKVGKVSIKLMVFCMLNKLRLYDSSKYENIKNFT